MTDTDSRTPRTIVQDVHSDSELPEGWSVSALGAIVDKLSDGSHNPPAKESSGKRMLSARNILDGGISFDHCRLISEEAFRVEDARTKVSAGDVLLTIVGSIGRSVVVPEGVEPFALQRSVAVIKPKAIDSRYLMHYFRAPVAQSFFEEQGAGTAQSGVYLRKLGTMPIYIPPLEEQRRIVAKIEGLLTHVNSARERLAKAPTILKRFRQAVLAAACSGQLTQDWRHNNPTLRVDAKVGEGDPPDNLELPESWNWFLSSHEFDTVTSGSRGWAKYYADDGPIFIRVGNLDHDSIQIDLTSVQHVRPPSNAEGLRTRIKIGDILVSVTADVGMIALIDAEIGEAYINQHVALARPLGEFDRRHLAYFLSATNGGQRQFQNLQRGATKVGLGLEDIRSIWIARPPREEQQEIVRRVEALFKLADAIEKRVAVATKRAEKLTRAILAKAFRGELVPTEAEIARREGRTYEPASALLARIRAEHAISGTPPKTDRIARRAARART